MTLAPEARLALEAQVPGAWAATGDGLRCGRFDGSQFFIRLPPIILASAPDVIAAAVVDAMELHAQFCS